MLTTTPIPPLPDCERQKISPPAAPDGEHDYLYGYILESAAEPLVLERRAELIYKLYTSPCLAKRFGMCSTEKSTLMLFFAVYSKRDKIVVGIESGNDTIPYGPHIEQVMLEVGVKDVGEMRWVPVDKTFFYGWNVVDGVIDIVKQRTSSYVA
ncbi:hypothetical protein MKEN_00343300 [Mycena kentingensis (nom. inval.)]|nr:hypothetical protein MKEN_00343300 [Mycena kentingensis (nom. inval.)]